jgi:serine/threonine protein kinase
MNDLVLIGGRYHQQKLLGQGGIAAVYLALDSFTGRQVALKMARTGDPKSAEAIKNEFSFAIRHRHPALATPYNLININNSPIIIMPFIDGITPSDSNGESCGFFGQFDDNTLEKFIASILEGAAFIHFSQYVYNDFKPSNYIFRKGTDQSCDMPILLDFNLVTELGLTPSVRGTIEYMAPELLQGGSASISSDLYSIGATLFELFTGRPPFGAAESSLLIKMITEDGLLDLTAIPDRYKDGISSLLARNPQNRPENAHEAANILGVDITFDQLLKSHAGYYFSSSPIPFSDEVKKEIKEFVSGIPERALVLTGLNQNSAVMDFILSEYAIIGFQLEKIDSSYDQAARFRLYENLMARNHEISQDKNILLLDDISQFSTDDFRMIRAFIRPPRNLPIIISARRWDTIGFPAKTFDPLHNHVAQNATREVLKCYLKTKENQFETISLIEASGGDPELLYTYLIESVKTGNFQPLSQADGYSFAPQITPSVEVVIERALRLLDSEHKTLLSQLSAWGGPIPMVLLAELNDQESTDIEALIEKGYLIKEHDSVLFCSGALREILYDELTDLEKQKCHRYWAEAVEKHLFGETDFAVLAACHWGKSDDFVKGFKANLTATKELFGAGELARARVYAESLLSLSDKGGGAKSTALMVFADILKQEGNYSQARNKYLDLLRGLGSTGDNNLRAETYKDLGDLYRSMKKPRRALFYTHKALELFQLLGMEQGVANCHNNIGLICWVRQQYENALQSFFAATLINEKLGNFQELAKIQSNIGIIKDIIGQTSEVASYFENAYRYAQKASDPWFESLSANNLGYFYIRQNVLDKAKSYLEEALAVSQRIGYAENEINSLNNLGLCHLRSGDLFGSLEYNQRALDMAESLGNKNLALDARLYLAEACILMGNFALANNVLCEIESDNIYSTNKEFGRLVDLFRSWWHRATGNFNDSLLLSEAVANYARSVKDHRLQLEAELASGLATLENDNEHASEKLKSIANRAIELGHLDLFDQASLAICRSYLSGRDLYNSENWAQKVLDRPGQSQRMIFEAQTCIGEIKNLQGQYNDSIRILSEVEINAASSGFIPLALEASIALSEAYSLCGKLSKEKEISARAWAYAERIISSLPDGKPSQFFRKTPFIQKLLKKNVVKTDKELCKA